MNEWNDDQWREFFGDHSLELRTDTVLCLIFAKEMIYNPCWTCAHTWLAYMGLSVACGLCVGQLGSFLRRIYDAS